MDFEKEMKGKLKMKKRGGFISVISSILLVSGKAAELTGSSVSHGLSTTNSIARLTYRARYTGLSNQNPVMTNANTSLAFYINT